MLSSRVRRRCRRARAASADQRCKDVPLQGPVLTDRLVGKAVDLADAEDAMVQRAEHRPAAFGAEIEREEPGGHNLTATLHRSS